MARSDRVCGRPLTGGGGRECHPPCATGPRRRNPHATVGVVMAKFFIGLVTGVVLVFLSLVLLFFAALRFREKPPQISDRSVLVLRLNGDIPEKAPLEFPDFLGGDKGG